MTKSTPLPSLRFVLLQHRLPEQAAKTTHFDLMIERQGDLRTWSLAALPRHGVPTVAEEIVGHRKTYLDYEGPVSGNRGSVTRVDYGTYETVRSDDKTWEGRLAGTVYQGALKLVKTEATHMWQLTFTADSPPDAAPDACVG